MKLSDLKVGAFVLLGLVLAGLVIFLIGDERRVFDRSVTFRVEFDDVAGLKRGAPLQMGGVRIGQVTSVRYGEKADDARVYVVLSVVKSNARRIRSDSVVHIVNKGLLGDKMVNISKGTKGRILEPGELIPSKNPDDILGRVGSIAGTAETTMGEFGALARTFSNERLHKDIRDSASSLKLLLRQLTKGQGYPHRFLTDEREAERISKTVRNIDRASVELAATLRELRLTIQKVRAGPGFAHDMLFGKGAQKEIAQVGTAADELGKTIRAIREGNGFAHDVLFGTKGGDIKKGSKDALSNVTEITRDVRDIVKNIKRGKGTLGALLVDPSVYEDVKRLLGNIERNAVLRALVRYSIKKADKKPKAQVGAAP